MRTVDGVRIHEEIVGARCKAKRRERGRESLSSRHWSCCFTLDTFPRAICCYCSFGCMFLRAGVIREINAEVLQPLIYFNSTCIFNRLHTLQPNSLHSITTSPHYTSRVCMRSRPHWRHDNVVFRTKIISTSSLPSPSSSLSSTTSDTSSGSPFRV